MGQGAIPEKTGRYGTDLRRFCPGEDRWQQNVRRKENIQRRQRTERWPAQKPARRTAQEKPIANSNKFHTSINIFSDVGKYLQKFGL